jgi:NDP-sugar pyrophosphorylase family protein
VLFRSKNYSEANKNLEKAVEDKVKGKIKKSANNAKNIAAGKSQDIKNAIYAKKGQYIKKNTEKGKE